VDTDSGRVLETNRVAADLTMSQKPTSDPRPVSPNCSAFVLGPSSSMRPLERVFVDIAPTEIPILILGESGTGKEVVALEIHARSRHCNEPLVKCMPGATAVLNQLQTSRRSVNDVRCMGSIFFDDIGELDQEDQNRVLQLFLDAETISPGAPQIPRVLSATSRNLEQAVRDGRFRKELYYRISGVCLRLPALRDRAEDIPPLLDFLLRRYASLFCRPVPYVSTSTLATFMQYSWPGNIRELENVAREIVLLGDEKLLAGDFALGAFSEALDKPANYVNNRNARRSLKQVSREASRKAERGLILHSLEETHWNRKRTAKELQISYKALLYKMKQLGLDRPIDSPDVGTGNATVRKLENAGLLG